VQYITPSMKQLKHDNDSAVLVRGEDIYKHFQPDIPAINDLNISALEKFQKLNKVYKEIVASSNITGS